MLTYFVSCNIGNRHSSNSNGVWKYVILNFGKYITNTLVSF